MTINERFETQALNSNSHDGRNGLSALRQQLPEFNPPASSSRLISGNAQVDRRSVDSSATVTAVAGADNRLAGTSNSLERRTASQQAGLPDGQLTALAQKYGIDIDVLSQFNAKAQQIGSQHFTYQNLDSLLNLANKYQAQPETVISALLRADQYDSKNFTLESADKTLALAAKYGVSTDTLFVANLRAEKLGTKNYTPENLEKLLNLANKHGLSRGFPGSGGASMASSPSALVGRLIPELLDNPDTALNMAEQEMKQGLAKSMIDGGAPQQAVERAMSTIDKRFGFYQRALAPFVDDLKGAMR